MGRFDFFIEKKDCTKLKAKLAEDMVIKFNKKILRNFFKISKYEANANIMAIINAILNKNMSDMDKSEHYLQLAIWFKKIGRLRDATMSCLNSFLKAHDTEDSRYILMHKKISKTIGVVLTLAGAVNYAKISFLVDLLLNIEGNSILNLLVKAGGITTILNEEVPEITFYYGLCLMQIPKYYKMTKLDRVFYSTVRNNLYGVKALGIGKTKSSAMNKWEQDIRKLAIADIENMDLGKDENKQIYYELYLSKMTELLDLMSKTKGQFIIDSDLVKINRANLT